MRPEPSPTPTWDVPSPTGYPAAIESAGSVAAPLLAGFGLTFAGLVITNPEHFRYVDLSVLLLVIATVLLIYAIQFGFFARQHAVTPAEFEEWWPDLDDDERRRQVLDEQRASRGEFDKLVDRFRIAYHLGVLFLLAGVAAALVPAVDTDIGALRLAAVAVVAAGALIEVIWIGSMEIKRRRENAWLEPQTSTVNQSTSQKEHQTTMPSLKDRAIDVAPIKAPAMNITLGSAGVLSLAAVLTVWQEAFEFIFGDDVSDGIREGILIATIAAIVAVAAADMLARAISARQDATHIVPWGKGWKATWAHPDPHQSGFIVAGMRVQASNPDQVEYLLVKEDEAPAWRPARDVVLDPPA